MIEVLVFIINILFSVVFVTVAVVVFLNSLIYLRTRFFRGKNFNGQETLPITFPINSPVKFLDLTFS